ncbi:alanine racemase, biosynthetic [bacterium BMS3Abin12]|nr:alanine racemase, biosynthetic [bacterium BMS3Abin12]
MSEPLDATGSSPRARAVIDLRALRANLQYARHRAPGSRVMAIVKANAYGHGLLRVAHALGGGGRGGDGADAFGVACMSEALALRAGGVGARVVLLEGVPDGAELELAARRSFEIVVHHDEQVTLLERAGGAVPVRVWVKLDTGMHRLGFPPQRARELHARLTRCGAVREVAWMTHLACADDRCSDATPRQLERFRASLGDLPGERSVANSGGLLGWPETHLDWVRPGILLYGVSPFPGWDAAQERLRPVMTLQTRLIAVKALCKGDAVGYGGAWVCPEDMPVGVAAIGYGDGYPRHAGNGTPILVNGRRAALIGRVSMDMIGVDLRGHPEARAGDPVVLWGPGLPVEEIARHAGTIPYELLCAVSRRVAVVTRDDPES